MEEKQTRQRSMWAETRDELNKYGEVLNGLNPSLSSVGMDYVTKKSREVINPAIGSIMISVLGVTLIVFALWSGAKKSGVIKGG